MRNKNFYIYSKGEAVVAIKDGFNWAAFFFSELWSVLKGLWLVFFTATAIFILLGMFISDNNPYTTGDSYVIKAMAVIVSIIYGDMACRWEVSNLRKRGYKKLATIKATSKKDALGQFSRK